MHARRKNYDRQGSFKNIPQIKNRMTAINCSHSVFCVSPAMTESLHATKRVRDFDVLIYQTLHLAKALRLRTKWSKMAVMRTACQKIRFQGTAFYNNFFFLVVCRRYHNFHLFKCFLREIAKTAANAATSHNVMIPTCAAVLKTCPPALTVMPTYS